MWNRDLLGGVGPDGPPMRWQPEGRWQPGVFCSRVRRVFRHRLDRRSELRFHRRCEVDLMHRPGADCCGTCRSHNHPPSWGLVAAGIATRRTNNMAILKRIDHDIDVFLCRRRCIWNALRIDVLKRHLFGLPCANHRFK